MKQRKEMMLLLRVIDRKVMTGKQINNKRENTQDENHPKPHTMTGSWGGGGERGGGEEPRGGRQIVRNEGGGNKNRTANGRGSSTQEKRMEDYFTRKPRKKRKDGT